MKKSLKTLLALLLCAAVFQACGSDDGESPQEISLASIVGHWGISTTTVTGSSAETLIPCQNTLDIQANGNYLFILNHWGEVAEGTLTVNPTDSTVTLTSEGQTQTIKLVSVTSQGLSFEVTDGSGGASAITRLNQFTSLDTNDCASITESNLIGQWELTEVENVKNPGQTDDGPQVGMIIDFQNAGVGSITFVGDVVTTLTYEFLDDSNIKVVFDDDDDDDNGSSGNFSIFHVDANQSNSTLEMIIADANRDDDDGGVAFNIEMTKQN